MITWEIPDFAFYNNQLLLHFGTIAYMPWNTHFLSPDIRLPTLRRTNGSFLSIDELFDRKKLNEIHVFDRQILAGKSLKTIRTPWVHVALERLTKTTDLDRLQRTIINITNVQDHLRTEDLWKIIFTRLIVHVFFLNRKHEITRVAHSFQYVNFVQTCVSSILPNYPNLTRALGIHLRTWAADVSIGSIASRECVVIHRQNPLHFFFQCQLSSNEDLIVLLSSIQRVQTSSDQPIYLATDDEQSVLVLELKRRYFHRLIYINETCHREHPLSPMVQSELLTRTETFLGSFFSTLSLVVAIRRDLRQTYFIQTTTQFYFYQYLTLIVMMCIFISCLIFFKIVQFFCQDKGKTGSVL